MIKKLASIFKKRALKFKGDNAIINSVIDQVVADVEEVAEKVEESVKVVVEVATTYYYY
jgi:hypothetical protein